MWNVYILIAIFCDFMGDGLVVESWIKLIMKYLQQQFSILKINFGCRVNNKNNNFKNYLLQKCWFEYEGYSENDKDKTSLAILIKLTVRGLYMPSSFQSYDGNKIDLPFKLQNGKKQL